MISLTSLRDYVDQHKGECELFFRNKRHQIGKPESVTIGIIGVGNNGKEAYRRIVERYSPILDKIFLFGRDETIFRNAEAIEHLGRYPPGGLEALATDCKGSHKKTRLQEAYEACTLLLMCIDAPANEQEVAKTKNIDQVRQILFPNNLPLIQELGQQLKNYAGDVFIMTNPIDEIAYAFARSSQIPVSKIHGLSQLDLIRYRSVLRDFIKKDESWTKAAGNIERFLEDIQLFGPHTPDVEPLFSQTIIGLPIDDAHVPTADLEFIRKSIKEFYTLKAKNWVDDKNRFIDDNIEGLLDTLDAFFFGGLNGGHHFVHMASYLDITQESIRKTIPAGMEQEFFSRTQKNGIIIGYRGEFDDRFQKVTYFPAQEHRKDRIVGPYSIVYEFLEENSLIGSLNQNIPQITLNQEPRKHEQETLPELTTYNASRRKERTIREVVPRGLVLLGIAGIVTAGSIAGIHAIKGYIPGPGKNERVVMERTAVTPLEDTVGAQYSRVVDAYGGIVPAIDKARQLLITGSESEAERIVKAVLHLDQKNYQAIFVEANIREKQHDIPEAKRLYQQTIDLNPNSDELEGLSYFRLGSLYELESNRYEAERNYFTATQIQPDNKAFKIKFEQITRGEK